MRRQLVHRVSGQQLLVSGPEDQPPRSLFDFGALGFDPSVANALIRGFIALQGHNVIESQRLVWRDIRCFAAALWRKVSLRPLPTTCISDLKRWLEKSHYGPKTTQGCMNSICRLLRWCVRNAKNIVDSRASLLPAQFQQSNVTPRETFDMALTGDMTTYRWGLEANPPIAVDRGDRVEVTLRNTSMMAHPMHLHGHHFQVVAIDGRRFAGAIRDTVLVPPRRSVTIAVDAKNPGQWAFHCHHLYHMATGMMATFAYNA
jgi:hypothetical protein